MTLKSSTLTTTLSATLLLGLAPFGHCDLIKQGATYHRDFLAYDTSGNNLTASAASTFVVQQSAAGAAPATITPTITYKGAGHFDLVYTAAIDSTPGSSALIITAPGATQVDINDQVIGFDPASDLGAAALATANTGIGTLTPLVVSGKFSANALSLAPAGSGGGGGIVTGYAAGQDPYTLLMAGAFITIPADHTTSGVPEALTLRQMLAIPLAVPASDNVSTAPVPSSTATTSYYLAGQTPSPATLVYVGTVTYNAAGQQSGRTVKIAQPFPAVQ